jgi:hypothetical protein
MPDEAALEPYREAVPIYAAFVPDDAPAAVPTCHTLATPDCAVDQPFAAKVEVPASNPPLPVGSNTVTVCPNATTLRQHTTRDKIILLINIILLLFTITCSTISITMQACLLFQKSMRSGIF